MWCHFSRFNNYCHRAQNKICKVIHSEGPVGTLCCVMWEIVTERRGEQQKHFWISTVTESRACISGYICLYIGVGMYTMRPCGFYVLCALYAAACICMYGKSAGGNFAEREREQPARNDQRCPPSWLLYSRFSLMYTPTQANIPIHNFIFYLRCKLI